MKKIVSILAFSFLVLATSAQSLIPIKFGVKVGVNITNVISTPNEGVKNIESSTIGGVGAGFYAEIAINDKWYINPELIYSQKGADFTYEYSHTYDVNQIDVHNTSHEIKLAYIELNPTLSYKASDKFSLNFGPSVSYILSTDYTIINDNSQNDDLNSHLELPEGTYTEETIDLGLNLGLTYYLSENILVNSTINSSFIRAGTISKLTNTGFVNGSLTNEQKMNTYEIKNSVISFSFAYLF